MRGRITPGQRVEEGRQSQVLDLLLDTKNGSQVGGEDRELLKLIGQIGESLRTFVAKFRSVAGQTINHARRGVIMRDLTLTFRVTESFLLQF